MHTAVAGSDDDEAHILFVRFFLFELDTSFAKRIVVTICSTYAAHVHEVHV